jgi:hypothetical protein
MPIALPSRRTGPTPGRESFLLKSMLVASALVVATLLVANEEFYFSAPGHSLSETEAALHLATPAEAVTLR